MKYNLRVQDCVFTDAGMDTCEAQSMKHSMSRHLFSILMATETLETHFSS